MKNVNDRERELRSFVVGKVDKKRFRSKEIHSRVLKKWEKYVYIKLIFNAYLSKQSVIRSQ